VHHKADINKQRSVLLKLSMNKHLRKL